MFSQQQKQTIIWYAVRRLSNKKDVKWSDWKNILKRIFWNLFQFELQKFEIIFPLENIECRVRMCHQHLRHKDRRSRLQSFPGFRLCRLILTYCWSLYSYLVDLRSQNYKLVVSILWEKCNSCSLFFKMSLMSRALIERQICWEIFNRISRYSFSEAEKACVLISRKNLRFLIRWS